MVTFNKETQCTQCLNLVHIQSYYCQQTTSDERFCKNCCEKDLTKKVLNSNGTKEHYKKKYSKYLKSHDYGVMTFIFVCSVIAMNIMDFVKNNSYKISSVLQQYNMHHTITYFQENEIKFMEMSLLVVLYHYIMFKIIVNRIMVSFFMTFIILLLCYFKSELQAALEVGQDFISL